MLGLNAQKQPCVCVSEKRCSSNCFKIYRKTCVTESIFNKIKFGTLLKKKPVKVFSCEYFQNY